jgi:hypothetical protein
VLPQSELLLLHPPAPDKQKHALFPRTNIHSGIDSTIQYHHRHCIHEKVHKQTPQAQANTTSKHRKQTPQANTQAPTQTNAYANTNTRSHKHIVKQTNKHSPIRCIHSSIQIPKYTRKFTNTQTCNHTCTYVSNTRPYLCVRFVVGVGRLREGVGWLLWCLLVHFLMNAMSMMILYCRIYSGVNVSSWE